MSQELLNLVTAVGGRLQGSSQLSRASNLLRNIFPNKKIIYIDSPHILIDTDTGWLVPSTKKEENKPNRKFLQTENFLIGDLNIFNESRPCTHIYIYSIRKQETPSSSSWNSAANYSPSSMVIRYCISEIQESLPATLNTKESFISINENLYEEFSEIANKMAIDKTKFIENYIKDFINKNK